MEFASLSARPDESCPASPMRIRLRVFSASPFEVRSLIRHSIGFRLGLFNDAFDAPVRDEPHQCDPDIDAAGNPRLEKRDWDGDGVKHR